VPKFVADSSVSPTGLKWAVDPVADVVTTAGDLIYGTAADTVARLGIGTVGQVLQVNSGATAPEWATPAAGGSTFVGAQVWNDSAISLSNATYTAITYTNEEYDSDGFHSNVTNTSRMTIPSGKGGKYLVQASIALNSTNLTGARYLAVYKNGSIVKESGGLVQGEYPILLFNAVIDLVATDYIEIFVRQDSNTTFSTDANNGQRVNWLAFSYLGA
jgi:hypothetical protein